MSPLEVAITQIGKEEVPRGSNWGDTVKGYLHSVGIDFPASWCMAFVYWCFEQSTNPNPLFKTGGVLNQFNHNTDKIVNDPVPGDVFIMEFAHGLGHTGFVEEVLGDKIKTIEGNTNDTGTREGYEVCRRIRDRATIKAFLRFHSSSL